MVKLVLLLWEAAAVCVFTLSASQKIICHVSEYTRRTCLFTHCCHLSTSISLHLSSNKLLPRDWCTPVLPWRHLSQPGPAELDPGYSKRWTARVWKGVFPVVAHARGFLKHRVWRADELTIWAPERKSMWESDEEVWDDFPLLSLGSRETVECLFHCHRGLSVFLQSLWFYCLLQFGKLKLAAWLFITNIKDCSLDGSRFQGGACWQKAAS